MLPTILSNVTWVLLFITHAVNNGWRTGTDTPSTIQETGH